MEKIFEKKLYITLKKNDFVKLQQRYHFKDEDMDKIKGLYQAVVPLLDITAHYQWKKKDEQIQYEEYGVVFVSLGNGIDSLQNLYMERKCLSEAYIIDCIGMEILMKSYEALVKAVQKDTGEWATKIDFLGDEYPMDLLPELYKDFSGITDIGYNQNLVLTPSKSVVFFLVMEEQKKGNPCHICENCSNTFCMFRQDGAMVESSPNADKAEENKRESSQESERNATSTNLYEQKLRDFLQSKEMGVSKLQGSYGMQQIFGNKGK